MLTFVVGGADPFELTSSDVFIIRHTGCEEMPHDGRAVHRLIFFLLHTF